MTFEERIHREIPISKYMQVRVVSAKADRFELAAPLEPNRNHEGTAFGGSVSSLALLSCWSLVTQTLDQVPGRFDYVVVQDSTMDYVTPISAEFSATSSYSSSVARFLTTLKKHGRARVQLSAEIVCQGIVCATLSARFVAQLKRDENPLVT
jgi:thioesterase domain-containing protein